MEYTVVVDMPYAQQKTCCHRNVNRNKLVTKLFTKIYLNYFKEIPIFCRIHKKVKNQINLKLMMAYDG